MSYLQLSSITESGLRPQWASPFGDTAPDRDQNGTTFKSLNSRP